MNPNVPSWGQQTQQNNNNQQQQAYQQQQYNPYAAQQQAQYNPYTQQQQQRMQQQYMQQQQQRMQQQQQQQQQPPQQQFPPQTAAYNPYSQQPQPQFQQQPQRQFYAQSPNNMNNPYQQQPFNPTPNAQYNPYQPQQHQPQQQQQPQQPNINNQYRVQNNMNQLQQNQQNQQNQQKENRDNWDSPDDHPRPTAPYKSNVKAENRGNKGNNNDLDKSDDEQNTGNTNQNQQKKKKKRRRGGRNKKNKENPTMNEATVTAKVEDITAKVQTLKIEDEIEVKPTSVKSKPKPKPKPKAKPKSKPKDKEKSLSPPKLEQKRKEKRVIADKKATTKQENSEEKINTKEAKKKKKKSKKVTWDAHDPREHLNLVLIGHVDAGKSTISGQILLATNQIDERTIAKYKKEAKEKNRESWWIAYIMDEDDEERNKGKTVECGRAHFDTANRRYTILDAPGHKNYVPNMISGASQADVAILVISARRGEFEAGFDRGGQTREHALLALTLGITRVIIVVNKMDTMEWSIDRYNDINTRVKKFLCDDIGFKKKYINILPISGQNAINIKTKVPKDLCPWYEGDTLIEALDRLKKVKRPMGDNLRVPILDRYKGDKGLQAVGKVEAGIIKKGDTVMIMPTEVSTVIIGLAIDDTPVESVGAGENILITFDKGALTMDQIYGGCVICSLSEPTKVVEQFLAEIYIHEIPGGGIMSSGYKAMFHSHNVVTNCEIVTIPHKLHKKTGKRSKMPPSFLRAHDRAVARIKLDQKCALESFEDCAPLGRFTLRDSGKTVVIGKIQEIFASKSRLKGRNDKY